MKFFEKCTAAMLGGPCSQHVTGSASQPNRARGSMVGRQGTANHAIIQYTNQFRAVKA